MEYGVGVIRRSMGSLVWLMGIVGMNFGTSQRAVGEKDEHICKAEFRRLLVGQTYTLPSKQFPELEVKETHSKLVIDSVEYSDIRTKPNHYTNDVPEELVLNSAFFEEPDKDEVALF